MKHQPAAKRKWWFTGILFIIALFIKIIAYNSNVVEQYYSNGFYLFISSSLRLLFGWLPFSIGDILYALAVIWLFIISIRFIRLLIRRKFTKRTFIAGCRRFIRFVLIIYIVFNLFWGLNYDRKGIAYQLHLNPQNDTVQELYSLANSLLVKVNSSRKALPANVSYLPNQTNFSQAVAAYENAQRQYSFLDYKCRSVKSSFYNLLGSYLGFSGYYNPFSAEAQVNTAVPPFLIPYVTCHEMAHQLGYATEDEANFVGYLAAKSSGNLQFQYSVYFDLFNYANGELFLHDSTAARANYKQLDTLVKRDIKTYRSYLQEYKNPLEPLITMLYGNYLKANNQPEGINTYSKVTAWLIAYRKKYGQL
jgi:hypothetical protein